MFMVCLPVEVIEGMEMRGEETLNHRIDSCDSS
jgi:hypothetical protein